MRATETMRLDPDDVARYLQHNTGFFETYAEMLANIYIPHPHGGRAIPIAERQIVTLREKNRALEEKLRELVQFGQENDTITERLHRIALALFGARDLDAMLDALYYNLREDFSVPHIAVRIWGEPATSRAEFSPAGQEVRVFTESLTNPYCVQRAMYDTPSWFGEQGTVLRSFAYVPLRTEQPFGLLVLASEDAQRFYPEMGTLYLKRLGELVSVAVARFLDLSQ